MQHLVEQYSQGPDVDSVVVLAAEDHFGGHVLVGAAKSVFFVVDFVGAPAKVAEFDVEIGVEEEVFGLG